MGINLLWPNEVLNAIKSLAVEAEFYNHLSIIKCSDKVFIHLVAMGQTHHSSQFLTLQNQFQEDGKLLVHLWEDVWIAKKEAVLGRIRSFLNLNKTLHGRKTKVLNVKSSDAKAFFDQYHLQGFVKAKFYYGLIFENEIYAMAGFSGLRPMKSKGDHYQSAELVRFAVKPGFTVTGGIGKLIQHFITQTKPDDVMTYADRDWSLGAGYQKLGFQLTNITPPQYLYLNTLTNTRYIAHRLPKIIAEQFKQQNELPQADFLSKYGYETVFNTGNLKYHLYCSH